LQAAEESADAMHVAEAAAKDWCGRQGASQAQLDLLQDKLDKAVEIADRLKRAQQQQQDVSVPRQVRKKAAKKMAAAVQQLRKAKKDAQVASRVLSQSYKQVIQAAKSKDYDRLVKQKNKLEIAKQLLLVAHEKQHSAHEMISQQRVAIKRLTKPKPNTAETSAAAQPDDQRESGSSSDKGSKHNEPPKPLMPTNQQLLDAATANAAMSNGASSVQLNNEVSNWQLLQEPATTIGHGCERQCTVESDSKLERCIKQCNGYESGQVRDGNTVKQWRATCKVIHVSECVAGSCQVAQQSECLQLELGNMQQMRVVTSARSPCPGIGDQTQFCTGW